MTDDDTQQIELLPCPFCGEVPQRMHSSFRNLSSVISEVTIGCRKCGLAIFPFREMWTHPNNQEAPKKWNALVERISGKTGDRPHFTRRPCFAHGLAPVQIGLTINNGIGIFHTIDFDGETVHTEKQGEVLPDIEYAAHVAIQAARDFLTDATPAKP